MSQCSARSRSRLRDHQPDFVQRIRYPLRYEAIVRGHAKNYDLDPSLLAAVIYTESRFNARARSDGRRDGPDAAAARHGPRHRSANRRDAFVVDDLYSPEINVRYGAWYLRNLLNRYGDERTALAAYHAGPGNVDSWRKQGVGIQFPETRSYVDEGRACEEDLRRLVREGARTALACRRWPTLATARTPS